MVLRAIFDPVKEFMSNCFIFEYAPALEAREQLNPFATPNVGSLLVFEKKQNSILVTDFFEFAAYGNFFSTIDKPISKEDLGMEWIVWPEVKHAGARELESKLERADWLQ